MPGGSRLDAVLGVLGPLGVTRRPLFGSDGLYYEARFFGFIDEGRLYFHTNARNRPDFLARYAPAGRPRGPRTVDRNFEVPADILADPELLRAWAVKAIAASRP